jgi:protein-tyrosine phosphatase
MNYKITSSKIICFVCTANICRSFFAEGFLKKRLREEQLEGIQVISAGVAASKGSPTTADIISIAQEFEVDLQHHLSQPLDATLISSCNMLLGMEQFHLNELQMRFPMSQGRVFLTRNFALEGSRTRGIKDPYGSTDNFLRACFDDIAEAVEGLLQHLKKL